MAKVKTNILLGMVNDIVTEYPNTNDFIQQKLTEKCDREGILIDEAVFFLSKSRSKTFLQTKHFIYQSQYMQLAGLRVPFVLLKWGLVYVYQKESLVYV